MHHPQSVLFIGISNFPSDAMYHPDDTISIVQGLSRVMHDYKTNSFQSRAAFRAVIDSYKISAWSVLKTYFFKAEIYTLFVIFHCHF